MNRRERALLALGLGGLAALAIRVRQLMAQAVDHSRWLGRLDTKLRRLEGRQWRAHPTSEEEMQRMAEAAARIHAALTGRGQVGPLWITPEGAEAVRQSRERHPSQPTESETL